MARAHQRKAAMSKGEKKKRGIGRKGKNKKNLPEPMPRQRAGISNEPTGEN